jgi:hypothetical protein
VADLSATGIFDDGDEIPLEAAEGTVIHFWRNDPCGRVGFRRPLQIRGDHDTGHAEIGWRGSVRASIRIRPLRFPHGPLR